MKAFVFSVMILMLFLVSCVKENTPTTPLDDTVDTTMAMSRYSGVFVNGPYGSVSGTAKIYLQGTQYKLALEGVSISNGPDLHVYLSKEVLPATFIDLGRLQSVAGNQLYDIPGAPDFIQYRYALIHCKQYNHLFGSAELR
ncbi:MAG: DM13 domain-containing protein [Chitinophagaceae bacterium]|nr:DM13 domain-containing protein [Chitinophagaceae bacterium]